MSDNNGRGRKRVDGSGKKGGKKRGRSRSRSRAKKVDPTKYWGDLAALPEGDEYLTSTPDPSTVVSSLGRPPIPGHENASKHYFNLVYERASALAVALAAAGGLDDYGSSDPAGPADLEGNVDASSESIDS